MCVDTIAVVTAPKDYCLAFARHREERRWAFRSISIAVRIVCGGVSLLGALAADAQTYPAYFANVAALTGNMTSAPTLPTVVALGGYYNTVGDGGGGTFAVGPGPCTANGGTIFVDMATPAQCYTRVTPSNNVREWGAKCGVVAIQPTAALTATWQPALHDPNTLPGHTNY